MGLAGDRIDAQRRAHAADLPEADLVEADLVEADLVEADLVEADLVEADLVERVPGVGTCAAPSGRPAGGATQRPRRCRSRSASNTRSTLSTNRTAPSG